MFPLPCIPKDDISYVSYIISILYQKQEVDIAQDYSPKYRHYFSSLVFTHTHFEGMSWLYFTETLPHADLYNHQHNWDTKQSQHHKETSCVSP